MSGKRKPLDRSPKNSSCSSDEDTVPYKGNAKETVSKVKVNPSSTSKESDSSNADFGYNDVASPGGSSTSSGPIYVRPPGFKYHAQEITLKPLASKGTKKKKTFLSADIGNLFGKKCTSVSPTTSNNVSSEARKKQHPLAKSSLDLSGTHPTKAKAKKEPLPMKLRAFPQSFWQQPNKTSNVAPGQLYSVLPPVVGNKDVTDVRPLTPTEEPSQEQKTQGKEYNRIIKVHNTDWLFKLFDGLDGTEKIPFVKRGRPKKVSCSLNQQILRDDDPCMVNIGSDALLPLLPLDKSQINNQPAMLTMISLQDRDKSVSLPALHIERNYSQLLSELVVKL